MSIYEDIKTGFEQAIKYEEYIKYFTHMQAEHKRIPLGGMAWDDVMWWVYDATETDKLFTRNELADMFPDLLGHIRDN